MEKRIELWVFPTGNVAVYRGNGFIPTEQLTEEEKEFIVECVHKELGWTRPAFEVDGSIGSPDYERGFKHGRDFQAELSAKSTDTDKVIAYLVHQKGYPISTNGEIPSYEETFEAVKNIIENTLSEEPMQKFNTDKLQEIAKPATPHKKPTPEDRAKFMEELHEYAESKKPDKSLEEAAEAYQQQVIEETKNHIHLSQYTYEEGFEDALHLISDAFIAGWEYRSECEESSIMGDLLKNILKVGAQHNFGFGPELKQCKDNEDESK